MAGIDLVRVGQLEEPVQAMEEALRTLSRGNGEIRPRDAAHEERIAREDRVADDEAAVLWTVSRRVQDADPERADLDLAAVGQRLERVVRSGGRVDVDGHPVFEREAAVAGDVVGVRVSLEYARDPHSGALRHL